MPDNQFNIGDIVRFIDPRRGQEHMRGWEGEVLSTEDFSNRQTIHVRVFPPNDTTQGRRARWHDEWYYPRRFELISATPEEADTVIQRTINKLMKRQKFYQTSKHQLPVWYAAYGD